MASKSVVRAGFIGVGGVARWAHLSHLSKSEDVELTAFCDVNKEAVEKAAADFKTRPYTDARQMLDSEELDAVFVCVPPFAHDNAELLVCERRLALFVEKPLGTTLQKAAEINAAVKKSGVVSAVGYN